MRRPDASGAVLSSTTILVNFPDDATHYIPRPTGETISQNPASTTTVRHHDPHRTTPRGTQQGR